MFRNWMRNRLGLSANPVRQTGFENRPVTGVEGFNPRQVGFETRPVGGPESFSPRQTGFENRPMGGPEVFNPRQTDFEPRPVTNFEAPAVEPVGQKRMGFALNPYMW